MFKLTITIIVVGPLGWGDGGQGSYEACMLYESNSGGVKGVIIMTCMQRGGDENDKS